MKIILVGGGCTLYFLCRVFLSKGHEVAVISKNQNECVEMARTMQVPVTWGDGSEESVLRDAGAIESDVVLAMTPHDHDNFMICSMASIKFSVPRVLALANDPDNSEIFNQLGIDSFSTAAIVGRIIEQKTCFDQITNVLQAGAGKVNITEMSVDRSSPIIGVPLSNAGLPPDSLVAAVIRGEKTLIPKGGTTLEAEDKIVLISNPADHGMAIRKFTGEGV